MDYWVVLGSPPRSDRRIREPNRPPRMDRQDDDKPEPFDRDNDEYWHDREEF
ncbi:MAG: hypothetical protein MPK62_03110 [Alphaproteobacteria bacterium]|nr:hypothetical protein [Alphaproteobacteria bacterium]MDA8030119.1 hypothetical protein [Alphaproteobacteria bacterium]